VFVGSDMTRAKAAIAAAARDTSDRVRVSIARVPGERPWPRGRVRERLFSDPRSPSATAPMGGRWRPLVTDLIQTMAQRAGQSASWWARGAQGHTRPRRAALLLL
jgi:hypothetical protein